MKRMISVLTVVLLCVSLVCPVFAANDTFVPSISEKDQPDIIPTPEGYFALIYDKAGNIVGYLNKDCIVITPVSQANTSTKIPEDSKKTLLDVHQKLLDGSMKIPYENGTDWVIRDLFDVSLLCDDHPQMLKDGNYLSITLDLGIGEKAAVNIMIYENGQWHPAIKTVNNGDGTVTVAIDRVGVVAVSVPAGETPNTGINDNVALWVVLMAVAAAALVAVVVLRRKAVH